MDKKAISKMAEIVRLATTLKEIKKFLDGNEIERAINQMSMDVSKVKQRDITELINNLSDLKKNLPSFIKKLKNIEN